MIALAAIALALAGQPQVSPAELVRKASAAPVLPASRARAASESEAALREKMGTWRGHWIVEDKGIGCKTTQSSGDARIDAIGCRAIQLCLGPRFKDIMAIGDSKVADDEKKKQAAAIIDGEQTCIAKNRTLAIGVLARAGTRK